jgi:DNA polymerase III delta prime subunit
MCVFQIKSFEAIDSKTNVLVSAPTGSGKTTLLESLIREYYKLQPFETFPENNILYINNLKEQGISYYRNEMKTFCQSRSVIPGKKKMIGVLCEPKIEIQKEEPARP